MTHVVFMWDRGRDVGSRLPPCPPMSGLFGTGARSCLFSHGEFQTCGTILVWRSSVTKPQFWLSQTARSSRPALLQLEPDRVSEPGCTGVTSVLLNSCDDSTITYQERGRLSHGGEAARPLTMARRKETEKPI